MSRARRAERGQALLLALLVVVLLSLALALLAALVGERRRALAQEEQTIRLTALADAALAETLARWAAGRTPGLGERELGGGTIGSEVRYLGPEEAEIVAFGELEGRRRTVRARVDLSGPRPWVRSWETYRP